MADSVKGLASGRAANTLTMNHLQSAPNFHLLAPLPLHRTGDPSMA